MKEVLVTVGTTEFDELLDALDNPNFLRCLVAEGFTKLVLQIGRGRNEFKFLSDEYISSQFGDSFQIEIHRYINNFSDFMKSFQFIIGHAGAGTLLDVISIMNESLQTNKAKITYPYIMVINDTLQGNHQMELSGALADSHFFMISFPRRVLEDLQKAVRLNLKEMDHNASESILDKFPIFNPENFKSFVDDTL
jgi:UDP-N-acetylglucosamine transferase subunit ALG13